MPPPIYITVKYNQTLQVITGVGEDPMIMSEGSTFSWLLQCIFTSYPEIPKTYAPGVLRFLVNGVAPKTYSPLLDGDEVCFWTE